MSDTILQGPVGIVGFGTIGQRWAAGFSHAGLEVRCFDPDATRWTQFEENRPGLMADLDALRGDATAAGKISFSTDMGEALAGVVFVQENGPEKIELKQLLLAEIERHIGDDVIVASSSSALMVTQMQALCRRPQRIVLGHPFNPAHLMPLVEIVGGEKTEAAALAAARAFYEAIGKKPVVLNREITGHLALRLMGAMWREAIAMARDGVASVEDIDRAFVYGPGPKWTLQGAFISNHLNAEGIESFMVKYGPTYQAIWDDLLDARLDAPTIEAVSKSLRGTIGDRTDDDLRAERDSGLVEILRSVSRHGAL